MRIAVLLLVACRATGPSSNAAGVAWQAPIEIATGGGTKGPWQQNDSHFDYVDDPSVALGAGGAAHVVWVDHRDKDIHFQVFADGKPRGRPTNVSRTPAVFSWLPRIVVADKNVFVLWQEIIFSGGTHGGEILFARSTDGGTTFADPINLSNSINGDGKGRLDEKRWHNGSLDLALAPNGTLHAAWTEYDGPLWHATSTNSGKSWNAPVQVAGTKAEPARAPALAIASDNTVYLAWTYGELASADVHVAAMTNGDRFGEPMTVATTKTYSDAPKLVAAGGTLHVAWAETSGGPFDPARIHYTRSRDGAKTFEPPTAIGKGAFPALAVDGDRIVVIWEIEAQERSRGLGLAIARGGKFGESIVVPHSRDRGFNGSHQGHLMNKLAMRGSSIAIVNSALEQGKQSRVWLVRGELSR